MNQLIRLSCNAFALLQAIMRISRSRAFTAFACLELTQLEALPSVCNARPDTRRRLDQARARLAQQGPILMATGALAALAIKATTPSREPQFVKAVQLVSVQRVDPLIVW